MAVASTMLALGTQAPGFSLPATDSSTLSLDSLDGSSALLVAFICNHCPYVKHVEDELAALSKEYVDRDVAIVGICSNDAESYPDDAPAELAGQKERVGFPFPYLVDESQEVAKAYTAACTPDFFLFDAGRKLVYRGQMDSSRPSNQAPVTGKDLREALEALLSGGAMPEDQRPSLGCGIKWKPGNEPNYPA